MTCPHLYQFFSRTNVSIGMMETAMISVVGIQKEKSAEADIG